MAARCHIQCVRSTDRCNPWERITHVGGLNADGICWPLTQPDAIAGIESGKWASFVRADWREVKVIVRTSRFGNKYLTAKADGEQPDNLLSLAECR
jgi:hypothetical protein